ncbi:MAG: SDR family oxidoreductase [Anaerolineales bacterium]
MVEHVVLITGANSGIGKVTARALAKKGATVIMHARDANRGESARQEIIEQTKNQNVHLLLADFADVDAIDTLSAVVINQFPRLNVLINNAVIIPRERTLAANGIEMQFMVNHLAAFLLTQRLLPTLRANGPARIVNVSSTVHQYGELVLDDLERAQRPYSNFGWSQYQDTKLMNVAFTLELAARLGDTNVTVNCLHPGIIRTKLLRDVPMGWLMSAFFRPPNAGAVTTTYVATSPKVAYTHGAYFERKRVVKHNKLADDADLRHGLWERSVARLNMPEMA